MSETTANTNDSEPASGDGNQQHLPASQSTATQGKVNFHPPAAQPTQKGPSGIRYDFNDGCRVALPEGDWQVRLRDAETDNVLFETRIGAGMVSSTKKYYVPVEIEIKSGDNEVFRHRLDVTGKNVLIQFPVGTLGDLIAWFPYAVKFGERHRCKLTCVMGQPLIDLFGPAYPWIRFVTPEKVDASRYYATYNIGLFFNDTQNVHQPCDFRLVGLHRTAGYILGVDPGDAPPDIALPDDSRPIAEKYVCIAAQSTTQSKYWNYPEGWRQIVQFLKEAGYRVICIDQKAAHGSGLVWNHIPYGAEDETGDRPLAERARWLRHAAFFVGLSSGLSWLAWAMRTPVVMISGFTHPTNEFHTPYRVINYHTCNSCWNDQRETFDHQDFLWCPRHAGTPRQFECTRLITPAQVRSAIRSIPGFAS
jgi:autotransporter strand-loop-strand O-heptosyltransferase